MNIKKTAVLFAASTMAVTGLNQAAFASTTLSVNGSTASGTVSTTGDAIGDLDFETNYGVPMTCTEGEASADIFRGISGPAGTHVGNITSMLFDDCSATSLLFDVEVTQKTSPWGIYTLEVPTKAQRYIAVEIRGITAEVLGDLNGNGQYPCGINATGDVEGVVDTQDDVLIINSGETLELDALSPAGDKGSYPSSCGGEVWDGDLASMSGTFDLGVDVEVV